MKMYDISHQRFGKLIVLGKNGTKRGQIVWMCLCNCGKVVDVKSYSLRRGITKSCGCFRNESPCSPAHKLFLKYKRTAIRRKLAFDLTYDEFLGLIAKNCVYCGIKPSQTVLIGHRSLTRHPTFVYNGIDRVNNAIGYILSNCFSCCGRCNRAKGKSSHSEFLEYLKNLVSYRQRLTGAKNKDIL